MIVCFYIEVQDDKEQVRLESLLNQGHFAFLDATEDDCYTGSVNGAYYPTLEDIETDIKGK